MLSRVVNQEQEIMLAAVMTRYADVTLKDLKVSSKFQLITGHNVGKPYQQAIDELVRVRDHYTMLNKLECVGKCVFLCGLFFLFISASCFVSSETSKLRFCLIYLSFETCFRLKPLSMSAGSDK